MAKALKKNLKPIRLIKKANDLIEARHSLSTWEMRIFLKIIFLVNEEANKGTTNFVIPIRELIKDFHLENSRQSYHLFREARKALATRSIQLYQQNMDTGSWEMVNKSLFSETAHSVKMNNDNTISDDDDGYIRLQLHDQIKSYLINIDGSLDRNYTLFDRNYAIELPIKILRFYLLLKRFADTGFRYMTVDEIRDVFDLQDKYKSFGNIKQRLIDKAKAELEEKTDIRFEYEEVKKAGSKAVFAVKFRIFPNDPKGKQIPLPLETRGSEIAFEAQIDEKFDAHFDKYFMSMREYGVSASTLTQWIQQYSTEHIEQCWKAFLDKVRTGRVNEKDKSKQGGYLRVLLEQADFSQKKKSAIDNKQNKITQNEALPPEIVLKKQAEKEQFEHDLDVAEKLFEVYPDIKQDILDLINRLEQTAYSQENIEDFPFLKSKIIFRLKQQFPEEFKNKLGNKVY
jgi:plasmid replication initiation protein